MAVSKPTEYPDMALLDEISESGNANKVSIPEEFKNSGYKEGQPFIRAYYNQQEYLTGAWIRYLEDQINNLAISAASGIIQQIYPVGAIWVGNTDTNPADFLGFGTWSRIEGRVLVGKDSGDTSFDGLGETGGSKTHSHSDTFSISSAGSHSHDLIYPSEETVSDLGGTTVPVLPITDNAGEHTHVLSGSIDAASNLPPYYVTSIWRRDA